MERFPPADRLHRKLEYDAVMRHGRRFHTPYFSLIVCRNSLDHARLGLSVSSKVGGAVIRNRIKRWTREVFRRNRSVFPERADVVVLATRPLHATFSQYREALLTAAGRARS